MSEPTKEELLARIAELEKQRLTGISRGRKRRRKRLRPRALPGHTLLRAVDSPVGRIGGPAHIPGRKQASPEAKDEGIDKGL
jgi:hypothetical protein